MPHSTLYFNGHLKIHIAYPRAITLIIVVGVLFLKVLNFTENDLIFENGVSNVDFGQVY